MKIVVHSIDEYIENLCHVNEIFDNVIRASIIKRPIDAVARTAVRYGVVLHVTSVAVCESGEYILELALDCGKDYHDSSNDHAGSRVAERAKRKIVDFAKTRKWRVLPGVIFE